MDCSKVYSNIISQMKDYIADNSLKSLVLGVSGGADSALVAALAYQVCKDLDIPLIGRSIPIHSNKQEELDRADLVGKAFCANFKVKDLTDLYFINKEAYIDSEEPENSSNTHEYKIRCGNLKARMRMIYLYDTAKKSGGLVLSTDNYTEYALSFWTLKGDEGDVGPIQEIKKTEVYELMAWIVEMYKGVDALKCEAIQKCIDAVPTDGLGITNSDLDQLGAKSYAEVDEILDAWIIGDTEKYNETWLKNNPVVKRFESTHFKRNIPYNLKRSFLGIDDKNWKI